MLRLLLALFATISCVAAVNAKPLTTNEPIVLSHQLPKWAQGWSLVSNERRATIADDDIQRHAGDAAFWDGIVITEREFFEAGFDWHLLNFSSIKNPHSVIWVVPHDDENGAFEAMIAAIKRHGGRGIVVNSGAGSLRRQAGKGQCGGRPAVVTFCDPNRNFSAATPLFTSAVLDHRTEDWQPIIALHTNGAGASGNFSLLDTAKSGRGKLVMKAGAYQAKSPKPQMANYDTLGLIAYAARDGRPGDKAVNCRKKLNEAGIHFWHERIDRSDGSLSNYLALNEPDIDYFNAESREETDLAVAAARHKIMIDAYLAGCAGIRK